VFKVGTDRNDNKEKMSKTLILLKDIKESHPLETSEFMVA
jgi:hypothetical protein